MGDREGGIMEISDLSIEIVERSLVSVAMLYSTSGTAN